MCSICHFFKVPWVATLPPGVGSDAPPTVTTEVVVWEHARVAAGRIPTNRRVRDTLDKVRGRARERARAPDEWT